MVELLIRNKTPWHWGIRVGYEYAVLISLNMENS